MIAPSVPTARRARRIAAVAAAAVALALLPLIGTVEAAHVAGVTERFAGGSRFATARVVAQAMEFEEADTVVVAGASDFADALAGALLAGQRGAPLLLTRRADLPADTVAALAHLEPQTAVILGGPTAVSAAVAERLAELDSVEEVERIGGTDRFDTARLVAERVAEDFSPLDPGFGTAGSFAAGEDEEERVTAILATGRDFPDALASGPLSAGGRFPILLTERGTLPGATKEALESETLGIEQVLVLGGPGAVAPEVQRAVEALDLPTRRLAGESRTETAALVAAFTQDELFPPTFEADPIAVSTGRDFPDALALAPLAAQRRAPLVITNTPTALGGATAAFLARNCAGAGAKESPVMIAGGQGAVSGQVEDDIRDAVVCTDFVPAGRLRVRPTRSETAVGEPLELTATGTNAKGQPAVKAQVTFEVFRELAPSGPLPEDARVYREGARVFRNVQAAVVFADVDGVATFRYTSDSAGEDRILVCTPPKETAHPGCTDEGGAARIEVPFANVIVGNTWVAADGGGGRLPEVPVP